MPSRPTSSARLLANATTPMRVAPESARLGMGWYTVLARMLMMRPPPCRFMWGTASRDIRAKNRSDRSTAVAHCSSVALRARASGGPPELLTRMSRRPKRSTVAAINPRMVSCLSRSPARARTSEPVASRIACAAFSSSPWVRLHTATLAPSSASTSAQARPRPLLAPPTTATLSLSSRSIGADDDRSVAGAQGLTRRLTGCGPGPRLVAHYPGSFRGPTIGTHEETPT
jgi:hypothetical protein